MKAKTAKPNDWNNTFPYTTPTQPPSSRTRSCRCKIDLFILQQLSVCARILAAFLLFCCYTSRAVKQQQHYGIFCFSNGVIHRRQSKDFRKGGRLACFCCWIFLRALRDTGCRRPECVCCWQLLYEVEISFVVLTAGCGMNKTCIAKQLLAFLLLWFFYADLSPVKSQ